MSEIFLGTSGWSYAEWEGILYPEKRNKLKQYSSIFSTVEINSTFYTLPKPEMVLGWAMHTPRQFIFTVKLPQVITHQKLLDISKGIEQDLIQFLDAIKTLIDAKKIACILVQLPPYFKFNPGKLESFFILLPSYPHFAIEFRNESWLCEEIFNLLEKYQVAYTIVDEPLLPPDVHVTLGIAYLRWHGRGSKPWFNYRYSEEELKASVPKVREASEKAEEVLGYFNNHFHGYAPENCLQIMQMLGIVTPLGDAALRRVTFYRKEKPAAQTATLDAWTGPLNDIDKILRKIANEDTIEKAKLILDTDFSLREDNRREIAAYIGDTTVDLNFEKLTITHYCREWSTTSLEKKFCHHIVKFFLNIDPKRARTVLANIFANINNWQFQSKYAVEFPK